jgi:heptosyltransferase III
VSARRYAFRAGWKRALAAAFDFVGGLFFRVKAQLPRDPKTILLVRLDHIGDVLAATGIPQCLKAHFPKAKLIVLTSRSGAGVIGNNPYVDEVITFEPKWFNRGEPMRERSLGRLASELRAKKIDLALGLRGDLRENYLFWRAGVGYSVGYGITGGGFFLDRELTYRWTGHEIQHSLDILRFIGIRRDHLLPALFLTDEEIVESQHLREEWGPKVVGIQMDAGDPSKFWPESTRRDFLERAFKDFPEHKFVFIGKDDNIRRWVDEFIRSNPSQALNLMGKGEGGVRELLVRVRACAYFIGSDSGPTHIAAAFGLPTLVLYNGDNDFERWRPLAENAEGVKRPESGDIKPETLLRWLKERLRA